MHRQHLNITKDSLSTSAKHMELELSNSCTFFKLLIGKLCNWESLCDIRPDCHHHFDASGTSNAMFDELAERSLMSPLGRDETYVCKASHIIIYCQILTLFSNWNCPKYKLTLLMKNEEHSSL